jgi:hypothetical protein
MAVIGRLHLTVNEGAKEIPSDPHVGYRTSIGIGNTPVGVGVPAGRDGSGRCHVGETAPSAAFRTAIPSHRRFVSSKAVFGMIEGSISSP